jgi:hypothetical protein
MATLSLATLSPVTDPQKNPYQVEIRLSRNHMNFKVDSSKQNYNDKRIFLEW